MPGNFSPHLCASPGTLRISFPYFSCAFLGIFRIELSSLLFVRASSLLRIVSFVAFRYIPPCFAIYTPFVSPQQLQTWLQLDSPSTAHPIDTQALPTRLASTYRDQNRRLPPPTRPSRESAYPDNPAPGPPLNIRTSINYAPYLRRDLGDWFVSYFSASPAMAERRR